MDLENLDLPKRRIEIKDIENPPPSLECREIITTSILPKLLPKLIIPKKNQKKSSESNKIQEVEKNPQKKKVKKKSKRQKVKVACTNCRHSHVVCSNKRPCERCKPSYFLIFLGEEMGITCVDYQPKRRGRKRKHDPRAKSLFESQKKKRKISKINVFSFVNNNSKSDKGMYANNELFGKSIIEIVDNFGDNFVSPSDKKEKNKSNVGKYKLLMKNGQKIVVDSLYVDLVDENFGEKLIRIFYVSKMNEITYYE